MKLTDREKHLLGYAIEFLAANLSEESQWIFPEEDSLAEEIFEELRTLTEKLKLDLYCVNWD